jgi:hypothetical protein
MTAQEILNILHADGIELVAENGKIRARAARARITDAQRALIVDNKTILLVHLTTAPSEQNCGSQARNDADGAGHYPPPNQSPPADPSVFKEYRLPNGQTLKLTKAEFDRVVDAIRLLQQQSLKLGKNNDVA